MAELNVNFSALSPQLSNRNNDRPKTGLEPMLGSEKRKLPSLEEFRSTFASLWSQIITINIPIDPNNPLYSSFEASAARPSDNYAEAPINKFPQEVAENIAAIAKQFHLVDSNFVLVEANMFGYNNTNSRELRIDLRGKTNNIEEKYWFIFSENNPRLMVGSVYSFGSENRKQDHMSHLLKHNVLSRTIRRLKFFRSRERFSKKHQHELQYFWQKLGKIQLSVVDREHYA